VSAELAAAPAAERAQAPAHRLASLLAPRSIALVGASPKADSVGNGMIQAARGGNYPGRLYLINPNYKEIEGIACYPSLAELPEAVEHAVLGAANARLEAQLAEAIRLGAKAATIFASCYLPDDSDPPRWTACPPWRRRATGCSSCSPPRGPTPVRWWPPSRPTWR
jgi:predicted CoA-binding protein